MRAEVIRALREDPIAQFASEGSAQLNRVVQLSRKTKKRLQGKIYGSRDLSDCRRGLLLGNHNQVILIA
jgi:hypothetical protein